MLSLLSNPAQISKVVNFLFVYPMASIYMTMDKNTFCMRQLTIIGPLSIAMVNYRREFGIVGSMEYL